jgi:hypothetical protein
MVKNEIAEKSVVGNVPKREIVRGYFFESLQKYLV